MLVFSIQIFLGGVALGLVLGGWEEYGVAAAASAVTFGPVAMWARRRRAR